MDGPTADPDTRERLEPMSDEELMEQFQQGVEEAFNILVERYETRLDNYLRRYVSNDEKRADILQETFTRVYRNRHSYKPIAKFSTWLYTIAGNLGRSEYRKKKTRGKESLDVFKKTYDEEEAEAEIPNHTYLPSKEAEDLINEPFFQQALDHLEERFREVIVLRDIQQLTYEEIAEITGSPMGTVKSRLYRTRRKLRDLLEGEVETG